MARAGDGERQGFVPVYPARAGRHARGRHEQPLAGGEARRQPQRPAGLGAQRPASPPLDVFVQAPAEVAAVDWRENYLPLPKSMTWIVFKTTAASSWREKFRM